jgi:hypothetical protein
VFEEERAISLLPPFSRLADAGMAAMDLVAESLGGKSRIALADIAARPDAARTCDELAEAAEAWRALPDHAVRHIQAAHRFAHAIPGPRPSECLRAVLAHHEVYGGGLRWFVLRDGKVEPRTPPRAGSARYRFRLWSLCRIASQCGVIRGMPPALRDDDDADEAESSEDSDD